MSDILFSYFPEDVLITQTKMEEDPASGTSNISARQNILWAVKKLLLLKKKKISLKYFLTHYLFYSLITQAYEFHYIITFKQVYLVLQNRAVYKGLLEVRFSFYRESIYMHCLNQLIHAKEKFHFYWSRSSNKVLRLLLIITLDVNWDIRNQFFFSQLIWAYILTYWFDMIPAFLF